MSVNKLISFAFLCCYMQSVCCLNILGLFPHPGKSHFDVFEPLLRALAEKGHNMTIISHFPQKTPLPRYRDISLHGDTQILTEIIPMDQLPRSRLIYYFSPLLITPFALEGCKGLRTEQVQEIINSDEKYDLIVMEMFNSDCFLGFVHKFKIPFIGLSSCTIMSWTNMRFGNIVNPAYIPNNLLPFSDQMSFIERLENTIYYIYGEFMFKYFMVEPGYEEARKHFGDDLPPLQEIAKNASLLLVNSHFSLNRPRPLVPNVVEAAGMFLPKVKPLPKNLEKYINESPHGVIYFSMGSMIKGHSFPEEKRAIFLKVFSQLKQRIFWKWENESLPGKPDNVMIQKWLPQFDILCHPNVVGFISHGGLLGTVESVNCGVPMVVMPQFGDQFTNAKALEASNGGVILDFNDVTEESLSEAVKKILDPSFNKKAKELSEAFRDRPLPPLDTAIYWVEYIARHKGAPFMRTAAVDMPFYQYFLLDVIAFILGFLTILTLIMYKCIRFTFRLIFRKAPEKLKQK